MREFTSMIFQVEVNVEGFPEDNGDESAKRIRQALLESARVFDADATVKETTA